MELAKETEEEHALHPAQIQALGNGWRAGLVPSTASQEWTLTFLSRNEAIRPKFLGCCMNLGGGGRGKRQALRLGEAEGDPAKQPRAESARAPATPAWLGGCRPTSRSSGRGKGCGAGTRVQGVPLSDSLAVMPLKIHLFVLPQASRKNEDTAFNLPVGSPPQDLLLCLYPAGSEKLGLAQHGLTQPKPSLPE